MVFCSPVFLFLFLPLVLAVYFLLPKALWNGWLLAASLLFYAWGERFFTVVMVGSIAMNYAFGLMVEHWRGRPPMKAVLASAVVANLGLLAVYKYANFFADSLNVLLGAVHLPGVRLDPVHLPIGISFFTFHALSYVIDVYRADVRAERNFVKVALYVTLFPQLIAGPILRYHHVAHQFGRRWVDLALFESGIRRFVIGFAKKVLIANTLALPADRIFDAVPKTLTPGAAWLGIVCYTLQIYFDFSGYSDMAIGLGRMFGFQFPENFNYPYVSRSIREFWRRWHISLSTWFRDYLYIPLGGSRVSPARHYGNLLTVFLLCGLWHGANWTFVVWGLYHGAFLVLEEGGLSRWLDRMPRAVAHGYCVAVVSVGLVFFRADSLHYALLYLRAMFSFHVRAGAADYVGMLLTPQVALTLAVAVVGSTPWAARGARWLCGGIPSPAVRLGGELAVNAGVAALFLVSVTFLASGTYNPFIYFRF